MIVHLVDGTYELYRQYYGQAQHSSARHAAVFGVVAFVNRLVAQNTGPVGVATDHIIESFRNDLYDGYKTSDGMEPEILEQIPVLEDHLRDSGVAVWPMIEFEADDALASAARVAVQDPTVHQVRIYSPDKDLAQCVLGRRVVQVDSRSNSMIDESAVASKFGVTPASIPDYLALVGDSADGYPGISGWGVKSTQKIIERYGHIAMIPENVSQWIADGVAVRGAERLSRALHDGMDDALKFLSLATLVDTLHIDYKSWLPPTEVTARQSAALGQIR